MKHITKILIFVILSSFVFTSCNDLLDVDSERVVFQDEYQLTSANDSLYSMFGIFSQLQKLADSYALLGELRGDLMDVTDKSNLYLKEINNFEPSAKNPYTNNIRDYYAVINNCNYVIHTVDTTVQKGGKPVLKRVYAAAKAIRAWTYMQLALNYQMVKYYDEPIMTTEAAAKDYPELTFDQLAPMLISDLLPYKDVEALDLGSFYNQDAKYSFFPIRFILGDLYLWSGKYEEAANEYHDLMLRNNLIVSKSYLSEYEVSNKAFTGNATLRWYNVFAQEAPFETITNIAATNQYGTYFTIDSLNRKFMLKASSVAQNNWKTQMYYHADKVDTIGDLRGIESYGIYGLNSEVELFEDSLITKYISMNPTEDNNETNRKVIVYRTSLLYLRYAEAVNRLGKPNLAMAVIKNGLNSVTLGNRKIIPAWEAPTPLPNYMDFTDNRFTGNIGIRMRGCGNVNTDTTYYRIPKLTSLTDSVNKVEEMIVDELALETAFEGNRFHDLMRFAIRRGDNAFLADKVAAKHTANKEPIRNILMKRENWYLKK